MNSRICLVLIGVCVLAACSVPEPPRDRFDGLDIVPRSVWGWERGDRILPEHTISKITIHHGGTTFSDDRDPAEYLRALQKWSRAEKDWIDIPYHFVIDLEGRIYEGRPIQFPGATNTSYDPASHALIVVVGNYDTRELADVQFEALARLAAFLANKYSIELTDIKAHKDYAPGETACPGAGIYRHLEDGSLLRRVTELVNRKNR